MYKMRTGKLYVNDVLIGDIKDATVTYNVDDSSDFEITLKRPMPRDRMEYLANQLRCHREVLERIREQGRGDSDQAKYNEGCIRTIKNELFALAYGRHSRRSEVDPTVVNSRKGRI